MVLVTYPPQTIAIIKRKHKKLYKKMTIPQKSFEGNKSKNTIQKCWMEAFAFQDDQFSFNAVMILAKFNYFSRKKLKPQES